METLDGIFSDDELNFLDKFASAELNVDELKQTGNVTVTKVDRTDCTEEVIHYRSFDNKMEFTRFNTIKKGEEIARRKAILQNSINECIKTEDYEQASIYKKELENIGK